MENWKRKITKLVKPTENIKSGQHLVSSDFYLEALCIWELNATKVKSFISKTDLLGKCDWEGFSSV